MTFSQCNRFCLFASQRLSWTFKDRIKAVDTLHEMNASEILKRFHCCRSGMNIPKMLLKVIDFRPL